MQNGLRYGAVAAAFALVIGSGSEARADEDDLGPLAVAGVVVVAASLAAAGVSIGLLVASTSERDEAERDYGCEQGTCPPAAESQLDDAEAMRGAGIGLVVAAMLMATTGSALIVAERLTVSGVAIELQPQSLTVRF